jgi:hypothetical protein
MVSPSTAALFYGSRSARITDACVSGYGPGWIASCWLARDDVRRRIRGGRLGAMVKNLMLLLAFVIPLCVLAIYVVVEIVK